MFWFVWSTKTHSHPDVLSSGTMGSGDTQDLAEDFQQGQSHPIQQGCCSSFHQVPAFPQGSGGPLAFIYRHPSSHPPKKHCKVNVVLLGSALQQREVGAHKCHVHLVGSSVLGHSHLTLAF